MVRDNMGREMGSVMIWWRVGCCGEFERSGLGKGF